MFNQIPNQWSFMNNYKNEFELNGWQAQVPQRLRAHSYLYSRDSYFPCYFCGKVFRTPQALGGHQHAHRKERMLLENEANMNQNLRKPNPSYLAPNPISLEHWIAGWNAGQQLKNQPPVTVQDLVVNEEEERMEYYTKPYLDQLERKLWEVRDGNNSDSDDSSDAMEVVVIDDSEELDLTLRL